jgi:hypothetical protein
MAGLLERILATSGNAGWMPPASAGFPAVTAPLTPEAEWEAIQERERLEREAADRRNAVAMTRKPIAPPSFAAPDASGAGVQLALENAPPGTGVPFSTGAGMLAPPITLTGEENPTAPIPAAQVPMPMARPEDLGRGDEVGARSRETEAPTAPARIAPPVAPMAPQVGMGPAAAAPSFFDRISRTLGDNSNTLLALGAGFAGAPGWGQAISRASAAAIPARALDYKQSLERSTRGVTTRALIDAGVPVQQAIAAQHDPDLKKALITKYMETKPAQVVNGRLVREHPDGSVTTLADYGDDKKPPSGWQWRDASKTTLDYIPNGPADPKYLREKGEKNAAPPGYEWRDPAHPDQGLKVIPGGPAEKVDAQVAARLGLAKNFLKQLPAIKADVQKGMATGAIDAAMAYTGYGRAGELRRQIESGAEALLRNLTGAGMSIPEAERYVRRYELQPHDTIDRVMSKLGQLEVELGATIEEVGKGRGGSPSIQAPAVPKGGVYVWDPATKKLVPAK